MVDRAKSKAMNLDQVHKKIDYCLKNRDKWVKEYKNRLELVKGSRVNKRSDYWNAPFVKEAQKKAFKYEQDLEEWDRIRGEKVEEEVEVEETQEETEQEQEELEEAIAPTNHHIP